MISDVLAEAHDKIRGYLDDPTYAEMYTTAKTDIGRPVGDATAARAAGLPTNLRRTDDE